MKRNDKIKAITIGILSVGAFALTGCSDEAQDVSSVTYSNLENCLRDVGVPGSGVTEADCKMAYNTAIERHKETAPHYEDKKLCEEEHGLNSCEQTTTNGHSSFTPFFMGYMMGNMLNSSTNTRHVVSNPIYSTRSGLYSTMNGDLVPKNNGFKTVTKGYSFSKPASTFKSAPLSRTAVASRGGFGKASTSFGG